MVRYVEINRDPEEKREGENLAKALESKITLIEKESNVVLKNLTFLGELARNEETVYKFILVFG